MLFVCWFTKSSGLIVNTAETAEALSSPWKTIIPRNCFRFAGDFRCKHQSLGFPRFTWIDSLFIDSLNVSNYFVSNHHEGEHTSMSFQHKTRCWEKRKEDFFLSPKMMTEKVMRTSSSPNLLSSDNCQQTPYQPLELSVRSVKVLFHFGSFHEENEQIQRTNFTLRIPFSKAEKTCSLCDPRIAFVHREA